MPVQARDLVELLNQMRPILDELRQEIANLRIRVETLEAVAADLARHRPGFVGVAGGQPKPADRGKL